MSSCNGWRNNCIDHRIIASLMRIFVLTFSCHEWRNISDVIFLYQNKVKTNIIICYYIISVITIICLLNVISVGLFRFVWWSIAIPVTRISTCASDQKRHSTVCVTCRTRSNSIRLSAASANPNPPEQPTEKGISIWRWKHIYCAVFKCWSLQTFVVPNRIKYCQYYFLHEILSYIYDFWSQMYPWLWKVLLLKITLQIGRTVMIWFNIKYNYSSYELLKIYKIMISCFIDTQELYELLQRIFLRQVSVYASEIPVPYPKLVVLDFNLKRKAPTQRKHVLLWNHNISADSQLLT